MAVPLRCLAAALAGFLTSASPAQSGGDFVIARSVTAAGSADMDGGGIRIVGTAAQHDAGRSSAGGYAVEGGFWAVRDSAPTSAIFVDGFEIPSQPATHAPREHTR